MGKLGNGWKHSPWPGEDGNSWELRGTLGTYTVTLSKPPRIGKVSLFAFGQGEMKEF